MTKMETEVERNEEQRVNFIGKTLNERVMYVSQYFLTITIKSKKI